MAIRSGARPGAIPPDGWDDKNIDDLAWQPYTIMWRLKGDGVSWEEIERTLRVKYRLKPFEIMRVKGAYERK